MIRHLVAEGMGLLKERPLVSAGLTVALAVALTLGGLTLSAALWIRPILASGTGEVAVAVLLRPHLEGGVFDQWLATAEKAHPDWRFRRVPPDELAASLGERFPYLRKLLAEEGQALLPPLLEVTAPDPAAVRTLEASPAVLAVGPVATIHRTLASIARRIEAGLTAITVALVAIAFLLASIWVHLELYRHADEIAIMRLVGATEPAIRGPYLVSAAIPGLAAGLLAAAATRAGAGWLSRLTTTVGLPAIEAPGTLLAGLVAFGLLVPLGAAAFTLARHARLTDAASL